MPSTVAEAFGPEIADELARWAIDALCAVPEKLQRPSTQIPASLITTGREVLDRAGVDWRALVRQQVAWAREREVERQRQVAEENP